ncbi:phosphoenolpyruvate--protein phosphotransferase [Jannaschia aquimarina]|uniref:phosphoenolpyruvate--protein phosphotransferase n=1 Tax=Jannaschia aquimarina TaxID=935700 RepID=A0A0D1CSI3_9RHOB|nr:phosphoenolpyruvate--protein phosphotransferase [Jannaschia aquimarina]KIT17727.1 Phosphoenolpyruvate-protein phosphotransferase [Jannaschia aquimarina]SNS78032.1 PTSINtr with GAF domain, PtsP [Jannaschia aquimarina]
MPMGSETESRKLLRRLQAVMAEDAQGQERLDKITELVADSMGTDVCSIYLHRDEQTLELCATRGLNPEAVHVTRMRVGEGLVGRVARRRAPINTADAPSTRGFRYMPETGEEVFSSFLGVPVLRLGERLGVLVVQSKEAREYSEDEVYALEVVAMVLAEMTELGAFVGEGEALRPRHAQQILMRGVTGQEGAAEGVVHLHDPRVVVSNPVADDPEVEVRRLRDAVDKLRISVDQMLSAAGDREQAEVIEAFRMFAYSRSWLRRMEEDIAAGLSAEAAVEKEQTTARLRMGQAGDAYLRDRLADLDDLSNRLLRELTGQGNTVPVPDNAVLVARNLGPGELLEYGRQRLRGVVLEEGSVGSHAAIVARAWAIPLVIQARGVTAEALSGDPILVDGDQGLVHLRPDDMVRSAFREKLAMAADAQKRYAAIRDRPCVTRDGHRIELLMNAGLMADLPSLPSSGAEGVGLFRTELQFLVRNQMPRRGDLAKLYSRVMDAAQGKDVTFRTLDIGSDKVLPYMKPADEPNPALGWRAIRVGLDKRGIMRMQLQALLRAANGRPLRVMFPFIAQTEEFIEARAHLTREIHREKSLGHPLPERICVGAMIETPSIAFAPRRFYEEADFVSIGGNDLKQFFFAADRENERVRRRYDTLNVSFLSLIEQIVARCAETGTPVSFCGEDAGRPVEALCFAAMGLRRLSMRPASIGPVKHLLLRSNLSEVHKVIAEARETGEQSVRGPVMEYLRSR